MVYYIVFCFSDAFLMSYMAINVNVQYNDGFLPDIILLTQCYLFKCHEEVLYLQPLIPPKRGMLRRSRCVLIFL